jgi:hypothetical protein
VRFEHFLLVKAVSEFRTISSMTSTVPSSSSVRQMQQTSTRITTLLVEIYLQPKQTWSWSQNQQALRCVPEIDVKSCTSLQEGIMKRTQRLLHQIKALPKNSLLTISKRHTLPPNLSSFSKRHLGQHAVPLDP